MNVLLTYPPQSLSEGWKICFGFPTGIMCLGAFIEKRGIEVSLYYEKDYNVTDFIKAVVKRKPKIIGISCDSLNCYSCFELAKVVKSIDKNIYVVLGGIHAALFSEEILKTIPFVDIIVRGEGEETFWELLRRIWDDNKKGLKSIKGISYRDTKGNIIMNNSRPYMTDLDKLPLFSYSLIDLEKVENFGFDYKNCRQIFTVRGCPYSCRFCASSGFWKGVCGKKSIQRVIEEIRITKDIYKNNFFYFLDLSFSFDKKRAYELCKRIIADKIKFEWHCVTRVDCVNKDLLQVMKQAGCIKISYGVESFSGKMLKLMGKKQNILQSIEVLDCTRKLGIVPRAFYILGFPGEDNQTLEETREALKKINKKIVFDIQIFQLFPGSSIYTNLKRRSFINDNIWFTGFKPQDFTPMFYSSSFVKELYRIKSEIEETFDVYKQRMNA